MNRTILHCDLNNFYASVECVMRPELKNVPLIVGGDVEKRHGIVLAKNPLAKARGIKTGDTIWQALKKEPNLVSVPPQFDLYMKYSKMVFAEYTNYTSKVEAFGPDECWLDVTGSLKLFGSGVRIADDIRKSVKEKTGLTLSVGVSFNKIFAKLAGDIAAPDSTLEITKENFQEILYPLDADKIMGVGRKTLEKLKDIHIKTIGDLANASPEYLERNFGKVGLMLSNYARGLDSEPVREYVKSRDVKSIGHGLTTVRDLVNYEEAGTLIYYLAELVAIRMRKAGVKGSGIAIHLRDNKLEVITRQCKLPSSINTASQISNAAISLLKANWDLSVPLRSMSVSVFDLSKEEVGSQISMFDNIIDVKAERLEAALDKIRARHGGNKIVRANLTEQDFIVDKNDSEDFLPFMR